jgi:glycosyltransferase involved in cell wall biosynthesis
MSRNIGVAPATSRPRTKLASAPLPRVAYVLTLDPGQKFGSMEEQITLLAERFREEGSLFTPVFNCDPGADASQFHARDIDAQCYDLRRFSWRSLLALRRFLRTRRIDILHWNFVPLISNPYVWMLSALTPSVRHWFTDHISRRFPLLPPPRGMKKLAKRVLLRRYGKVICVSAFVERCLADHQVYSNLVSLLHFINTDRFCPDASERRRVRTLMNAGKRFVLLAVGHLIPEKGMDLALRALAQLPANVTLWIVGKGPEEHALRGLISELQVGDRAVLLGHQRHVQPYVQAADCLVCPSLWAEAAGLVNIEAQACGTPVIASRIGGIPEYVADGETGLLFTPNDPHDLARCVHRLLDDPDLCSRFARAARIHAVERFSHETRLQEWLELYRSWRG